MTSANPRSHVVWRVMPLTRLPTLQVNEEYAELSEILKALLFGDHLLQQRRRLEIVAHGGLEFLQLGKTLSGPTRSA